MYVGIMALATVSCGHTHEAASMAHGALKENRDEVLPADVFACLAPWCMDGEMATVRNPSFTWRTEGWKGGLRMRGNWVQGVSFTSHSFMQ